MEVGSAHFLLSVFHCFTRMTTFAPIALQFATKRGPRCPGSALMIPRRSIQQIFVECLLCSSVWGTGDATVTKQPTVPLSPRRAFPESCLGRATLRFHQSLGAPTEGGLELLGSGRVWGSLSLSTLFLSAGLTPASDAPSRKPSPTPALPAHWAGPLHRSSAPVFPHLLFCL